MIVRNVTDALRGEERLTVGMENPLEKRLGLSLTRSRKIYRCTYLREQLDERRDSNPRKMNEKRKQEDGKHQK